MSLGKLMGLEVDEGDINELMEEHAEELTTEKLKKLQIMQHTGVLQEISSGKEEVEPEEVISSGGIKEMLAMWEKLSSFIENKHLEKVLIGQASALFNDTCLTHFCNILKGRQMQTSLDRFLFKRPASENAESSANKAKSSDD